ncbi:hypothetical protein PVAP13_7KG119935 [Panicum virgatum]|uniref:Uncharacterized protein n=1 Tax=Panicum virgatum TaxID=38727 RepID=A0A8T0QA72_PANVG|nr:hypothetical protein PVAP13_7KG119935 [Panicum virgatum]
MVPARNLQLRRDAHAAPCAAAAAAAAAGGIGVTTAPPSHMAQEPIDHHHHHSEPSNSKLPPPPQERQADLHGARARGDAPPEPPALRPLQVQHAHHQEAAGTSGSSSGNGGAGDWLRLGLAPASPAGSPLGAFAAGPPPLPPQPRTTAAAEALPGVGAPPGAFLRHAAPGIPQASITLPAPRAGPPWLPPWSPAAAPPPPLIPFGHRAFYTPGAGAGASSLDATIRVVLPPSAIAAAAGVWFVLQAAPHQGREPFLPQIPRSYLRIKDGRVTVRLLIKYLAAKLGLEDESEVANALAILHTSSDLRKWVLV